MLGNNARPTKKDFYAAMDLMKVYVQQHPRSKSTARRHAKLEKEIQKTKALRAECEKASTVLYKLLMDALPEEHHELLGQYGMMSIAEHECTKDTYWLFDRMLKKTNKLLAARCEGG
jgi:hypothetical protein